MRSHYQRLVDASTPGSFEGEGPMTAYVHERLLNGDVPDDEVNWDDGSGGARFGRRILYWTSTGFVGLIKLSRTDDLSVVFD